MRRIPAAGRPPGGPRRRSTAARPGTRRGDTTPVVSSGRRPVRAAPRVGQLGPGAAVPQQRWCGPPAPDRDRPRISVRSPTRSRIMRTILESREKAIEQPGRHNRGDLRQICLRHSGAVQDDRREAGQRGRQFNEGLWSRRHHHLFGISVTWTGSVPRPPKFRVPADSVKHEPSPRQEMERVSLTASVIFRQEIVAPGQSALRLGSSLRLASGRVSPAVPAAASETAARLGPSVRPPDLSACAGRAGDES